MYMEKAAHKLENQKACLTLTCRQESGELGLGALLFSGLSAGPALLLLGRVQLAPHDTGEKKNGSRPCWKGKGRPQTWRIRVGKGIISTRTSIQHPLEA